MSTDGTGRQSPLTRFFDTVNSSVPAGDAAVVISERLFLGHLNLRGNPDDARFTKAAADVLGLDLPTVPNTVAEEGEVLALWLGPDEWLVVTPADVQTSLSDTLEDALEGTHAAVTDVTGGQTVITLRGSSARDVLAKGCPLDLHRSVFGPGQCAQTIVGKANVTIRCVDESPSFELVVRRSFAEYMALWLYDSALEYGAAVVPPSHPAVAN